MKELRIVSWRTLGEGVSAATEILRGLDLERAAELTTEGFVVGLGRVILAVDDPRLPILLERLRAMDAEPSVRGERQYTDRELDQRPWLILRTKTVGLLGGANMDQPYDFSNACPACT